MHENERAVLSRDCAALLIPAGTPINLKAGTEVYITQSLGGNFTIMTDGMLARIPAQEADALGFAAPAAAPTGPSAAAGPLNPELLWNEMRTCYDPEIPVNIVDLGLIYDCKVDELPDGGNRVEVKMTLTAPGCGMGPAIARDVESKLRAVPGVTDVYVEVVWDPTWNQSMMTDAARLQLGLM